MSGAARGEEAFYDRQAARFWDPAGPMRALHVINPLRARRIADGARATLGTAGARPFDGLAVLDVGCAVGLLAEALARGGGTVAAVDVSAENIRIARAHAAQGGLAIDYRRGTLEDAVRPDERFDLVTCLEVVEHVAALDPFLRALARTVRPGGIVFVSSIARTPESLALAKIAAEYVLGILPRGTHRWSDFRNPDEVDAVLAREGFRRFDLTGMGYAPVLHRAWWQRNARVNWMGGWRRGS